MFKNKKTRLLAILSMNIATLSVALIISTLSWFKQDVSIGPVDNVPGSILTSYFDKRDLPQGFNETLNPHGSSTNPYVISRPVHLYNLVRLQELGNYGFGPETYFQFGKQFNMPVTLQNPDPDPYGETYPFEFYPYSNDGVFINDGTHTPYLNMKYYRGSNALSPIGSARHPFESHINGNYLTVTNLYIKGEGYSDIGIFGYVAESAYIEKLYFDNVEIDAAGATANALGSMNHVAHNTHVYIGYLGGHIYNNSKFSDVYINNCHIINTEGNEDEMINTFGFFGHTDEPMGSSEDTSGYTSQLVAANAYNAIEFSNSLGGGSPLARRYTDEHAYGDLDDAITGRSASNGQPTSNPDYYTIDTNTQSGKPYSLSSIGYSSGDAGTFKYARYYKTYGEGEQQEERLEPISTVEPENVLSEKPKYIPYDENGEPDYSYVDDPDYEFYGKNDGEYIYYDETYVDEGTGKTGKWIYASVKGTSTSVVSKVRLNCHTISYEQTVGNATKTYYLKYQAGSNGAYDTLVPIEWPYNDPPQEDEYYFCFKTSFGHNGASRFTECSVDIDYYIFSPVGQNYLCTYCPKTPNGYTNYLDSQYLHTPIFVPEEGIHPTSMSGSGLWKPMKFSIGGPKTQITYKALENDRTLSDTNTANIEFDKNVNRSKPQVRGALQGSNVTHAFGVFGGHKMIANATGGIFTIGRYVENQTTSLNNGVNYKLTSDSADIVENSTLVIAGYRGEQTETYSIDYAMGAQMQNNRDAKVVKEVRDTSGYVLNDTTGVAKVVVNYVGVDPEDGGQLFTLLSTDGYLCFPKKSVFPDSSNQGNWLRSYEYEDLHAEGHTDRINYSYWKYVPLVQYGRYTRYRFQNYGDKNRYLTYNINNNIFATYDVTANPLDDDNIIVPYDSEHPEYHSSNFTCWFYIYKQQHGQTIQNVHYTVAKIIEIDEAVTHPFKDVEKHDLLVSDISHNPTDEEYYELFDVDPSFNVYFNTTTSQVQYFEAYVRVWKRVNLVSELHEGDTVMIGAQTNNNSTPSHYFMGSQANNYRNRSSSISFKPPYVQADSIPTNAVTLTLTRADSGGWRFDTGSGFLYAAGGTSSSSNYLRTETQPDSNGNCNFSISILTDGTANIVSQGRNLRCNKLQYGRVGSGWFSSTYGFSCFSSNQTAIQIYRLAQSSADRSTYVGDLINNFEPFRMDAIGPNIDYYPDYMKMNSAPSIANNTHLNEGDYLYPSSHFQNAITLLIDANGSRDLGTLKFEFRSNSASDIPYFMLNDGSHYRLDQASAIDKDTNQNDNVHSYLLNINALNIDLLTYYYIKGEGYYSADYKEGSDYYGKEFKVCASNSEDLTKYLVVFGAPAGCEITNVTFTFNAIPGNVGYPGPVDYRSATYDANGFYTGTVEGGQRVEETALCIYYDILQHNQQLSIYVQFDHSTSTYIITIDTANCVLTEDLTVNIFKYDNTATSLVVIVNGVSTQYDEGTVSIVVPANSSPQSP